MKKVEKEAKKRARDFTDNKERQAAYECGFLDGADRMRGEMQKLEKENAEAKGLLKKWQQANICDAVVLFADTEEFLKRG